MNFFFLYQRRMLRRERLFRDRLNPLEFYDELEIKNLFRLERPSIIYIADLLNDRLSFTSARNCSLTPIQQVCLALRFYASGCHQLSLGTLVHVDQATVSRTCWKVTEAICDVLGHRISLPANLNTIKDVFYEASGFPNTIGCIDCTHIEIKAPSLYDFPDEYINRKGWHSLNVQAVCDANCIFVDVEIRWPGSVHDSRIFCNSEIGRKLFRNDLRGMLLGDSGYGLYPFLLTPFRNPTTPNEENFNRCHKRTRVAVERSFGQLKQRFGCLQTVLKIKLERVPKTALACFILHNVAKERNDAVPANHPNALPRLQPVPGNDVNFNFNNVNENALRRLGEQKRREVALLLEWLFLFLLTFSISCVFSKFHTNCNIYV